MSEYSCPKRGCNQRQHTGAFARAVTSHGDLFFIRHAVTDWSPQSSRSLLDLSYLFWDYLCLYIHLHLLTIRHVRSCIKRVGLEV